MLMSYTIIILNVMVIRRFVQQCAEHKLEEDDSKGGDKGDKMKYILYPILE